MDSESQIDAEYDNKATQESPAPPVRRFTPIQRTEGTTEAERYLKTLCDRSFLSLWSYPSISRDQNGKTSGKPGDGKEICDLLVVFQEHIIIFSDKDCHFPDSGNLELDWSRWFRRAVQKSADQVYGAERWIKQHPDRLFVDRACTVKFPVELPTPEKAVFHRIVVAHDGARRCREELGGSGSLMIAPHIVGDAHTAPFKDGGKAFSIGQIDPARGYVHVFDDTSLDIVMKTLDTVSDFVAYLSKKERFITSGRLGMAAGEENLLALYLQKLNSKGEHDFVIPFDGVSLLVPEGHWEDFARNPQRLAQIEANEISYSWDALMETFFKHIHAGTSYTMSHPGLEHQEKLFRFFAREPRTRRRILARGINELISKTPINQRATRVVLPSEPGDPYYVFLLFPRLKEQGVPEAGYREVRGKLLEMLCSVVKLKYPEAQDIVGIATETGMDEYRSEDAVYFDARQWTEEDQSEAQQLQNELGLLVDVKTFGHRELEYPDVQTKSSRVPVPRAHKSSRYPPNRACYCGSGQKYKRCCGRTDEAAT